MSRLKVFVPNGPDRQRTATMLVGSAEEFGIPQRDIRTVPGGFFISEDLAARLREDDVLPEAEVEAEADDTAEFSVEEEFATEEAEEESQDYFDPADYTVAQVKEFVTDNPEIAADVLAVEREGKNRPTLIEWLADFQTSGNRAAKNTGTDKE